MFVSAEMRWFWNGNCPKQVHDWFFTTGSSPGGGQPRIDKYLLQPHEREIGLKERGDNPGLEIKGLVGTVRDPALAALTSDIEIWCKWSCGASGLKLLHEITTTKTRWLRKFDTSKPVRLEIPLETNEKPRSGYSLPVQGCNVELTQVKIGGRSELWWTLGFEAFGSLETVSINFARAILPEVSDLARLVASGAVLSYPEWLSARFA